MSDIYFKPAEILEIASEVAEKKVQMKTKRILYLAILGGMYIGFGGLLVTLVATGSAAVPYGILRLVMGLVFCIGLILVVVGGAELFTGSTILYLSQANKKNTYIELLKNWGLVYLGNFIGALILVILIITAKQYTLYNGQFGEMMIKIATSKLHHSFITALALGVLCNIFVCLGVWLSMSSKCITDKIMAIIFPIMAFAALGFEHSVANMYLLFAPWLLKIFDPAFTATYAAAQTITLSNILLHNMLPVTIGNIIGGVFIWYMYRQAYKK